MSGHYDCWNCGADQAKLLDEETVELRQRSDRLAAELAEVIEFCGGHKDDCRAQYHKGSPPTGCTCGWTALRERHAKGRTE